MPAHTHASTPRALVIVNLGTPAAPTAEAVRTYLREFLTDKRVVQIPHFIWKPLLNWLILPRRSPAVAEKYAEIWMPEGSPLLAYGLRLAAVMNARLTGWQVRAAMRYGEPALTRVVQSLHEEGHTDITLLPLYPQYSTTTTGSVEDAVAALQARFADTRLRLIHDYHQHPAWAAAIAQSIRQHWATHGRGEKLLFSYHGIPERLVRAGDPYAAQCEASTAAIAAALGIGRDEILLTYQSRFGRERWLQPYTLPTLEQLGREGVKQVDIICPGFAVDCLETLEEITLQNAEAFRAAGGAELRYIPCLNDSTAHADALAALLPS
ncbi:ferrochelatase [Lysobacteraceae bacterium NML120232]|nr:ferrochelatase [Xanthomonadaceae bacterium NML08-0793]PJK13595.1 ferrochelatase [Xanthomonadaceae bacterium NML120232]